MKILVVSNAPFFGGGEQFVLSVLTQLADNTYFMVYDSILAAELPKNRQERFSSDSFWKQKKQLRRFLKENRDFDTIILNGGSTIFFAPFIRSTKHKLIIYRHTTNESIRNSLKRLIYCLLLHISYAYAEKVIHVSEHSKKQQKFFKKKATTIHNGVAPIDSSSKYQNTPKKPLNILYLGRTEPSKGIIPLINAITQIPSTDVHLDIVGTGSLSNWLSELNYPNITYHGFQRDVDYYYNRADIFIQLSDFENCPFTILDALKWKLPIISTNVGGIPELVHDGKNGFWVSQEPEDILMAIKRFIERPELIKKFGSNSFTLFESNFTLNHTVSRLKKVIKNIGL